MTKTEFLQSEDVSTFVKWLVESLPQFTFRLRFSPSRFVPGGLVADVSGFEEILHHYTWQSSWNDDDGTVIQSRDWETTRQSLQRLREKLHAALEANDNNAMLAACYAVLEWGGVTSAKPFLRRKAASHQLAEYLNSVKAALDLNTSNSIAGVDSLVIDRFDAGLTKIHALLDTTGLPIYDSRVGAAISMFYAIYRAEIAQDAPLASVHLQFPSGSARGNQVRDPHKISREFPAAPQFYTRQVSHVFWAQSQLKLGWIIQAVLEHTAWFRDIAADLPARAHAFEAVMFMIGYDLRCVPTAAKPTVAALNPDQPRMNATTWVPTAHTFSTLYPLYVTYRKELGTNDVEYDDATGSGFREWMNRHHGPYAENALRALCYPFKQTEFNLFERSLVEIIEMENSINNKDPMAIMGFLNDFAIQSDERRNVCLIDVWAVGYLSGRGFNRAQSVDRLVRAGFAGTKGSAEVLYSVGANVGGYLRLLHENKCPTQLFNAYFRDRLDDLAEQLNTVIA